MPHLITAPTRIPVPGGKLIEEHVGRVHTGTATLSVAHMVAPPGWDEPYQQPAFDEVTIVVRGTMRVEHDGGHDDVAAGQTILCEAGERIRYSNPFEAEAEYWAVCAPAFSPDTVHRDDEDGAAL
jgi:mannose-6-phosphate isomerase-like protein (cupin superfamily)